MAHYVKLFKINKSNDRETVLKNTYSLNELLHKKDIDENLRSQFVGTSLLYIKDIVKKKGVVLITKEFVDSLKEMWSLMTPKGIRGAIEGVLSDLLDGSDNKAKKIELLQKNVLGNQKVRALKTNDWMEILETIILDIYRYIDTDSSEGQDILNMFFIAFNKYTGKADKNQAFTPDHITEFMCRITGVDRTKRVLDATCGSGSFLVQAMVKELADCRRGKTEDEAVFTLPAEIFYPGASVSACCMVFTLGEPHVKTDGTVKETFFGYYKEDGFKKKKALGRVEQFDENGDSKWKSIEEEWLRLYRNHKSVDGLSATAEVTGEDEWLCEAYMKTDYSKLTEHDFQQTLNNYLAYLMKEGKIYES